MPKTLQNYINNFYLFNISFVAVALMSLTFMFFVQFQVEDVQDKIASSEREVFQVKEEISTLEAEWTYLTRPERIRILAEKYLQNTDFISVSQVKSLDTLKGYYFAKYQDFASSQVASR